jgi:hypothetical protein
MVDPGFYTAPANPGDHIPLGGNLYYDPATGNVIRVSGGRNIAS